MNFVILHVGSPGRYKNIPTVLKVVAELRARRVPAILVRVGRDLEGDEASLVQDLGIDGWVRQMGPLPDEALADIYRSSNALLFPSLKEGFGWPVVEAMATGLPVVASTDPAITASLAGAGLQAQATDVKGLADALEHLWSDHSLARELQAAGLARSKRYSADQVRASLHEVYRDVVSVPHISPPVLPKPA